MPKHNPRVILVIGLALFALYFGAGNLIFPVMLGAEAGNSLTPAMIGLIFTAVVLPVLSLLALATASGGITGIASRIGKIPGLLFTSVIFLSTGMLYAIPRVATVSFEMAVKPVLTLINKPMADSVVTVPLYMLFFLTLATILTIRPGKMTQVIGGWLTPALLALLTILIIGVIWVQPVVNVEPAGDFATAPLASGLVQGYFTMDAIASLVFGAIVIDAFRRRGYTNDQQIFGGVALSGVVAGLALALVYVGLAEVGQRAVIEGETNGAQVLANAATAIFGSYGQVLFGFIVLLACLTTTVGLLSASVKYFSQLIPHVSETQVLVVHLLVSYILANLGLSAILGFVAPLNQLIYPVVIAIVVVTLLEAFFDFPFNWSYRTTAGLAASVALFEALWSTQFAVFAGFRDWLDYLPAGPLHLPWIAPALVGLAVGVFVDHRLSKREA
ncbi:branched-chain amino acid transport system II carrier protein [Gleimia coleocanis DSM 15436]|uniref:Branched-chain amino acid transport system II carrier protein n=1 Tax=Gleimia coleocanis DSM 15436 TaxID=525245 RepID=C0W213_9ACTO|nr:branched-chain amino acid transport system II carrier protein [Gleimia coleocanis]EEH63227.1 branched-chain amino acid transport system II carrier protein [Gleimia coleocanis DSM 15436]